MLPRFETLLEEKAVYFSAERVLYLEEVHTQASLG